jgi:hypothetical protein
MDPELTPTMDRQIAAGTLPERLVTPPSALEALNRSELDAQITTARRYPRSLALFKQRALTMIKLDADTARSCYYALPRRQRQEDGSFKRVTITGPSVRLAEIVATAWGNIRAGARCVDETDQEVTAQGWCLDLESNNAQVVEISRRIVDRNGRRFPDDIVTLTRNAACAIARRNAIYAVIPRAFIKPLEEAAMKVASGDAKTLSEGRARAVAAFAEIGVSAQALCDKLERRGIEDIDLEDLALLGGLLTAIKERETTVEAEFRSPPPPEAGNRSQALTETVRRRRTAAAEARGRGAEPPTSPSPVTPDASPEPPDSSEPPKGPTT